ncbi:hypothetical protein [Ureibacillus aquaedulcis]|uniref:Lipoprotein n=1 Tax=Ureibacillus aquaedulcis TaxID=3058421 RepID=A0ABT8GM61_9BACL|nr:hypothetical protein [Ureibacillus sp. BA0131]MDN4492510.1 hypothetical protein [Ureibacillus sp. BA0131]
MYALSRTGLALVVLLSLIGCSIAEEHEPSKSKNTASSMPYEEEKPPNIKLTIGKDELKTYRGTYNWTFFDKHKMQEVTMLADFLPPTEIVNVEEGVSVNLTEPAKIFFETEPTRYEINVWDSHNMVATYNTFQEIKEKGKHVVEIVGIWEDSTATYIVALDIQ